MMGFGHVMKTAQYAVLYMVTFGTCTYPSRVWNMVTMSAVTSAGYERALGSLQTHNVGLPILQLRRQLPYTL